MCDTAAEKRVVKGVVGIVREKAHTNFGVAVEKSGAEIAVLSGIDIAKSAVLRGDFAARCDFIAKHPWVRALYLSFAFIGYRNGGESSCHRFTSELASFF